MKSEKLIASMLNYLIYFLNQSQMWSYEDLSGLYLKLSDEKTREFMTFIGVSILLNNVEIILSEKIEELI
jgi:hypothetical protein